MLLTSADKKVPKTTSQIMEKTIKEEQTLREINQKLLALVQQQKELSVQYEHNATDVEAAHTAYLKHRQVYLDLQNDKLNAIVAEKNDDLKAIEQKMNTTFNDFEKFNEGIKTANSAIKKTITLLNGIYGSMKALNKEYQDVETMAIAEYNVAIAKLNRKNIQNAKKAPVEVEAQKVSE